MDGHSIRIAIWIGAVGAASFAYFILSRI